MPAYSIQRDSLRLNSWFEKVKTRIFWWTAIMLVVSGQKFERRITLTPSGAKIICFTHQSGGLDLYYTFLAYIAANGGE